MAKLRKMLGSIESEECNMLMHLIETQSKTTLAAWAVSYVKNNYLRIYETECPGDLRLQETITGCEEYLQGNKKLNEIKPLLKDARQVAAEAGERPAAQAAARAIATACATVQTPTNALGFVFYGAAAEAYSQCGLTGNAEIYDNLAAAEFRKAYDTLQQMSVQGEENPAKIVWNC